MEGYKLKIHIKGIKNKCRKVDWHSFNVCENLLETNIMTEEIKTQCIEKAKKEMKSFAKIEVSLDWVEISEESAFTVTRWNPFDERNKKYTINIGE